MRKKALQQRRRSRAVDIVVAEDRHLFAGHDCIRQPRRRLFHVGQRGRIRQKLADGRIEEALGLLDRHAAPGEHPRDDVRHPMALRDGQGSHVLPLGQPMLPGDTGRRLPDIEEEPSFARHARRRPHIIPWQISICDGGSNSRKAGN
nr:hypothetical protein [Mesorhizobium sp. M1B.F.Ca.ET.045.04.1.1]